MKIMIISSAPEYHETRETLWEAGRRRRAVGLRARARRRGRLGADGTDLRLFRHLAARDQHRDHDYHVLDGVPDSEYTESRFRGPASQA